MIERERTTTIMGAELWAFRSSSTRPLRTSGVSKTCIVGRPIHFQPGPGKRFHDVLAFDRLGRVHVRAHYRGNPALGTVDKQRRVRGHRDHLA